MIMYCQEMKMKTDCLYINIVTLIYENYEK